MVDFNIGKGVYIWDSTRVAGGTPQGILARLKMAGVTSVTLKLCDGVNLINNLEPLIQTLRANQIRVFGWGYSYLRPNPITEAGVVAQACKRYQPDAYLIDVEHEAEGNFTGAMQFMDALRPALPDMALGLNTFWNVTLHPQFPWENFLRRVDFVCPQVYWRGEKPVEKLLQSKQEYANQIHSFGLNIPMPIVGGDLFSERGIQPTPDQVIQFLNAVENDPTLHGVFMWAADEGSTTPLLWQTFSSHHWQTDPNPVPRQPMGWAKTKYGMYVRRTPSGDKVGGLVKGQLVPLWEITESKWGAITLNRDQWIFVGDSNFVDVAIDPSVLPPPLPSGMYSARVNSRRGLNVRDGLNGTLLRSLTYDTVVNVYEERMGWARIHSEKSEWVNAAYLTRI